jgi:UDP-N-acetylmuramate--alanine ligase
MVRLREIRMKEEKYHHIFMIGVGGMGMAPLAVYLRGLGIGVTGTDDGLTEPVRKHLENAGVELVNGDKLPDAVDCVVHSSAILRSHPCMQVAHQRGLRIMRRGEMLARQARDKKLLAIVGSHGKTTTAAMTAWILRQLGAGAGYVGGGLFEGTSLPPSWVGEGSWLVAEIDESDGSLEYFSPQVTLLTNLDWDHADQYPREQDLVEAFRRLFHRTSGIVLLPKEIAGAFKDITPTNGSTQVCTFGMDGDYEGTLFPKTHNFGQVRLGGLFGVREEPVQAQGKFNLRNALAAFAACHCMGFALTGNPLAKFPGIFRRQTILHQTDSLTVLADYAHHPTEIAHLMESVREAFPLRKNVVVFQPHRYSRTAQFKQAFAEQLSQADRLVVLPVYSAGETPNPEGTSEALRSYLGENCEILSWMPGQKWLVKFFNSVGPRTNVIFIGAGSIEKTAHVFGAICKNGGNLPRQWVGYIKDQVSPHTRLATQEPLQSKTTIKVGGSTRFYAEPASVEDFHRILESSAIFGLPHYIIGRGSNLIVSGQGFEGLVLRLSHPFWQQVHHTSDGKLEVGAGARLPEIAAKACSVGMGGFEFFEGIPGTIGGAIRMNAGAMGGWTFDLVESLTVLDPLGQIKVVERSQLNFGYRRCKGIEGHTILRATLLPARFEDPSIIRIRMGHFASRRKSTQPRESSAGCIFRNPDGYFAGELIEQAGLKGAMIGDAQVSTVHGNFLVNKGKAGYKDIIGLVRHVRKHVRGAFNLELMPEVELLGDKWDNVL